MKYQEIYDEASIAWRNAGANGTVCLCEQVPVINLLKLTLQKIFEKNPAANILIVLPSIKERTNISIMLQAIGKYEMLASKQVVALTHDYIRNMSFVKQSFLLVLFKPETMNLVEVMKVCSGKSKFILGLSEVQHADDTMTLHRYAPVVYKCSELDLIAKGAIDKVIEIQVASKLLEQEQVDLERYDQSVKDCVSVCGTFDNIKAVRHGDIHTNRSAMQVACDIAAENGWSANLDMSIPFNRDIDKFYNPNAIQDIAETFFNHTRERNNLIARGLNKIVLINNILTANPDKQFLIISNDWQFAKNIVSHCENDSKLKNKVYPFYAQQESVYGVDEHGNDIVYKSGAKKGQRKTIGVKGQHDYTMELLSNGKIQAISATSTLPAYTNIKVDAIIYTSPFCEDLTVLRNRTTEFKFKSSPVVIFKLYNISTKEHVVINEQLPSIGKQIYKSEEINDYSINYLSKTFGD